MLLGMLPWVVVGAVAMAPILFALMPALNKAGKQYRKISRKIDKWIDALFPLRAHTKSRSPCLGCGS